MKKIFSYKKDGQQSLTPGRNPHFNLADQDYEERDKKKMAEMERGTKQPQVGVSPLHVRDITIQGLDERGDNGRAQPVSALAKPQLLEVPQSFRTPMVKRKKNNVIQNGDAGYVQVPNESLD